MQHILVIHPMMKYLRIYTRDKKNIWCNKTK